MSTVCQAAFPELSATQFMLHLVGVLGAPGPWEPWRRGSSDCANLPQAKSQQDKRLWVLHLKRLILENHAAKIPAKVRSEVHKREALQGPGS